MQIKYFLINYISSNIMFFLFKSVLGLQIKSLGPELIETNWFLKSLMAVGPYFSARRGYSNGFLPAMPFCLPSMWRIGFFTVLATELSFLLLFSLKHIKFLSDVESNMRQKLPEKACSLAHSSQVRSLVHFFPFLGYQESES